MNPKELRVKDIMRMEIQAVTKDTTLMAAAAMMRDNKVSSLVVKPEDNRDAYGIITRKDIVDALIEASLGGAFQLVEDVMTKPAVTVNPNMSIYNCQQMMRMIGVRRLPVVEGNDLKGILSNSDIFASLVKDLL